MGVTLYLFDSSRQLRGVVLEGISLLIHKEGEGVLQTEIPAKFHALPGEYIGMACVDDRYRLFEIADADDDDEDAVTEISADDAAIGELIGTVVERLDLQAVTAAQAAKALLEPLGFVVTDESGSGEKNDFSIYYDTAKHAARKIEETFRVFLDVSYEFDGKRITGRRAVLKKETEGHFAGRICERGVDADSIFIQRSGSPRPKIYSVGASKDDGTQVTIAEAEWSKAAGDPVDKPKGQTWVAVPEAAAAYPGKGQVFEKNDIDDPVKLLAAAWERAKEAAEPEISGTAAISDVEEPGKQIRVGDSLVLRLRSGEETTQTIRDIDRNYLDKSLTKVRFGRRELPDVASQVAKTAEIAHQNVRRGGGAGAKAESALWGIELHAGDINDLNSKYSEVKIIADANQAALLLTATRQELVQLGEETGSRINNVSIKLDAAEAALLMKADQKTVLAQGERLSAAEIALDGANAAIAMKASQEEVDKYSRRLSQAEINIDGVKAEVAIKASQDELDQMGNRVTLAESELKVQSDEISTRVQKGSVISEINQTAEAVKIKANRIELSGYVTASQLAAAEARMTITESSTVKAGSLSAYSINAGHLVVDNQAGQWKEKPIVTSIKLIRRSAKTADGKGTVNFNAVERVSSGTLYYFGY